MKLKKRKLIHSAVFCLCWFILLVVLVDVVIKFQTLVDLLGSYTLVEILPLLLVIIPTIAVYRHTLSLHPDCDAVAQRIKKKGKIM